MESKVNKELIKEWTTRLRSGEYRQIKGKLRNKENGRCCLGIACDIAVKNGVGIWDNTHFLPEGHGEFASIYQSVLPDKVLKLFGLPIITQFSSVVAIPGTTLAALNDAGASFEKIADIIEENFLS